MNQKLLLCVFVFIRKFGLYFKSIAATHLWEQSSLISNFMGTCNTDCHNIDLGMNYDNGIM